jgi:predicted negative regulator of RcsB-dependent stress response
MARRKVIQEIKRPDMVMRTFAFTINWVKANLKLCIAGAVAVLIICICVTGYTYYSRKQADKAEYLLSQGIRGYAEYNASGSEEALKQAEDAFNKTVSEKRKKSAVIAKLYLGRIYLAKGKTEEAKKMYKEAQSESSDPVVKTLSEKALNYFDKK